MATYKPVPAVNNAVKIVDCIVDAKAAVDGISRVQVKEVIASIDFESKPTPEEFVARY